MASRDRSVSWEVIWGWAQEIVDHIILAHHDVEHILAIGHGGIVPAALIAYQLGKRGQCTPDISTIYAQSYNGKQRREIVCKFDEGHMDYLVRQQGKLLIVDDIADSGSTLEYFKRYLPCSLTATLITKEESRVKPDYCTHVDGNDHWWIFPWEVK